MLNYLWAGMILTGVIFAAFSGTMPDITNAALDSAKEAITLCITMMGVMSLWMGLMEIAAKSGIIRSASRRIRPLIHFLFPRLPHGHPAEEAITTNIIANILGLGWAATPAGLKAMEELSNLEQERRDSRLPAQKQGVASNVHLPDSQYFFPAADSSQRHCLPQPIWKRQSCRNRWRRNHRNHHQHPRRHPLLQMQGSSFLTKSDRFPA